MLYEFKSVYWHGKTVIFCYSFLPQGGLVVDTIDNLFLSLASLKAKRSYTERTLTICHSPNYFD